jgi:hypothetical protein
MFNGFGILGLSQVPNYYGMAKFAMAGKTISTRVNYLDLQNE